VFFLNFGEKFNAAFAITIAKTDIELGAVNTSQALGVAINAAQALR
jgi:hypothetical protein